MSILAATTNGFVFAVTRPFNITYILGTLVLLTREHPQKESPALVFAFSHPFSETKLKNF